MSLMLFWFGKLTIFVKIILFDCPFATWWQLTLFYRNQLRALRHHETAATRRFSLLQFATSWSLRALYIHIVMLGVASESYKMKQV